MTANVGASMAGGGKKRRENDFYPTDRPYHAVKALIDAADPSRFGNTVVEPCCGEGVLSEALRHFGFDVISFDLVDRGYGFAPFDFLTNPLLELDPPKIIITNPPFSLAKDFIIRAHELGVEYIAYLLPVRFWNAGHRVALQQQFPAHVHYHFTWRMDVAGQKRPTMDVMWVLWSTDKSYPTHKVLAKPDLPWAEVMR